MVFSCSTQSQTTAHESSAYQKRQPEIQRFLHLRAGAHDPEAVRVPAQQDSTGLPVKPAKHDPLHVLLLASPAQAAGQALALAMVWLGTVVLQAAGSTVTQRVHTHTGSHRNHYSVHDCIMNMKECLEVYNIIRPGQLTSLIAAGSYCQLMLLGMSSKPCYEHRWSGPPWQLLSDSEPGHHARTHAAAVLIFVSNN
jgi:hypothetical protein